MNGVGVEMEMNGVMTGVVNEMKGVLVDTLLMRFLGVGVGLLLTVVSGLGDRVGVGRFETVVSTVVDVS